MSDAPPDSRPGHEPVPTARARAALSDPDSSGVEQVREAILELCDVLDELLADEGPSSRPGIDLTPLLGGDLGDALMAAGAFAKVVKLGREYAASRAADKCGDCGEPRSAHKFDNGGDYMHAFVEPDLTPPLGGYLGDVCASCGETRLWHARRPDAPHAFVEPEPGK